MEALPEDVGAAFDLPSLEALINDPEALELDSLAQWLPDAPPPACGGASGGESPDDVTHQLTSSDGSHSTEACKPLPNVDRQERIKIQNRLKQNRYRQRQKERREQLEATYEATATDLERERQLNESMRKAAAVQEALKDQKDEAVAVLEAAAGTQPAGQPPMQTQAAEPSDPDTKALAHQLWRLPFHDRTQILNSAFYATPRGQATLALPGGDPREEAACFSPDLSKQIAVEVASCHPKLLEAALAVTPEQLLKDRQHIQDLAAEILAEYDAGRIDAAEAQRRFFPATAFYSLLMSMLMSHKPEVALALMSTTRLPGESEAEEAARCRRIVLEAELSKEQLQGLAPLYAAHQAHMQQLGTETASTLQALREVQRRMEEQWQAQGLSAAAQQYLAVFDAAGALTHHSKAAMLLTLDFMSAAGTLIKPLQKMRMVALSRPVYLDMAAMIREALHHHGMLPVAGPGSKSGPRLLTR